MIRVLRLLKNILLTIVVLVFASCLEAEPSLPEPYGVLPSARQLEWHASDFYGFIHFTINTFTDKEWGYGDESPELFNPTAFEAEQIVAVCKEAGMKGIVVTAKHHDGFCLWPTKTTDHNIGRAPYKNGQGDIVKEFQEACKKQGLKFGIYLSPWDRNHADYGKKEYIPVFQEQLRELLTNYGPIFEVWFDGANGGTGHYGGANEKREIDRQTYYEWETTWNLVRELQPNAVIFSDVGPDIRWVGTEEGYSGDPCWHRFTPEGLEEGLPPAPGQIKYWKSLNGTRQGDYWMPAETNTSIRPGWFYHASEDDKVKTPEQLVDIYYNSIGHGTNFILNLPPDQRGLIADVDVESLKGFRTILDQTFSEDLAQGAQVAASNVRGKARQFDAKNLLDGDLNTFWTTDDEVHTASIILSLPKETSFNVVNIQEHIALGQRVFGWALDKWELGKWITFAEAESIGNRRLWRGPLQTTDKIRFRITNAPAPPLISAFSLHKEPIRLTPPTIVRDGKGMVNLLGNGSLRYTLNGEEPNGDSPIFSTPFDFKNGGMVKARTFDGELASATASAYFGYPKEGWQVLLPNSPSNLAITKVIDEDPDSYWAAEETNKDGIVIDFGKTLTVNRLSFMPTKDDERKGLVLAYAFFGSRDNKSWLPLAQGEFSNIFNLPIEQQIFLDGEWDIRYLKFLATETLQNRPAVIAELGAGFSKREAE